MPTGPAIRDGEVTFARDLGAPGDAALRFIGRIRSPWSRGNAPKSIRAARAEMAGKTGWAEIKLDPVFAPALSGLAVGQAIIVLYWMDRARRDLAVQAPRHVDAPRGTFALRSPNRPNPVALSVVRITALDLEQAVIGIDAIDCFDDTPVVDIKPWLDTIDIPPT